MANSYAGGNFNVDTSVSISGLVTLKGSAIASADKIYVYNAAVLTIDQSFACTLISLGEMSSGAASDGQRRGDITLSADATTTWAGAATATNSGLKISPASAPGTAGESKSCTINLAGHTWTHTNSAGAFSATARYCLNLVYGVLGTTGTWAINYPSTATIGANAFTLLLPATSAYTTASSLNMGTVTSITGATTVSSVFGCTLASVTRAIPIIIEDLTIDQSANATARTGVGFWYPANGVAENDNASITIKRWKVICSSTVQSYLYIMSLYALAGTTIYGKNLSWDITDIRPTTLVPTTLTVTDKGTSGELSVTWANAGSYVSGDKVYLYNSADNSIVGIFDATVGSGTIGGLTDGSPYTLYAKASSDNYVFSAASANATAATPTKANVRPPCIGGHVCSF